MRKERLWKKILPLTLSAAMALTLFPTSVFAEESTDDAVTEESANTAAATDGEETSDSESAEGSSESTVSADTTAEDDTTGSGSGSVEIAGVTYNYTSEAASGYTALGDTGYYYAVADGGTALSGTLYGTATLTYDEYYAGDVTDGYTYDTVTTATTSHGSTFANVYAEIDSDAGSSSIIGVSNINIAVDADLYVEAAILAAAGVTLEDDTAYAEAAAVTLNSDPTAAVSQYKTLSADSNGNAVYSATENSTTTTTVATADPTLTIGGTWGEYEIDVVETDTSYLRNTRSDEGFAVGSNVTGIIITAKDSAGNEVSVGTAHLANIWIQPYKISFNAEDTTATKNVSYSGDTAKYAALVGKTVTSITFLTPDETYVYTMSVYIKPAYTEGTVSGEFSEDMSTFTLDKTTLPASFTNGYIEIAYTIGSGKNATSTVLYGGAVTASDDSYKYTLENTDAVDGTGTYSVTFTCDEYSDIDVSVPILDEQKTKLSSLIATAESILEVTTDATLTSHKEEAEELLENENATMLDAYDLIDELTELVDAYFTSITVADVTYTYTSYAISGYEQIDESGIYYAVSDGETALEGTIYGTAALTYDEYYAGYVTEGYEYDAITTATVGDYDMFTYMYDNYDGTQTDGYNILGVTGVNVAVDADLYIEAVILTAAGKELTDAQTEAAAITLNEDYTSVPSQYKILGSDGTYSASELNVVATVDDAEPTLSTGSTWGEYEIDLVEDSTLYLRNSRSDTYTDDDGNTQTYAVGSNITGLILTTSDGYSVGLAYLANIWIQPYKLSFNTTDTAATKNIAYSGDTKKYAALVGKTITQITYLTTDGAYVYNVSVYVKDVYDGTVTGSFDDGMTAFTLDSVPEALEDAVLTVEYTVGSGKTATSYTLYEDTATTETVTLDTSEIADLSGGTYSVTLSSSNYADIDVAVLMLDSQKEELEALIETAEAILAVTTDSTLTSHKKEAEELLANENATMLDAYDLIDELTEMVDAYNFSITAEDSNNGTVTVADSAYCGETVTFTTAADYSGSLNGVTVTDADGKEITVKTLVSGTAYSFTMPQSAVTITASFGTVDIDNAKVKLSATGYTYDGTAKTPDVTVTYKGETIDASNYTVSYADNTNAGTATVTVTAADDSTLFYGSTTAEFTISKAKIYSENVSLSYTSKTYTGKTLTPSVTVTVDGVTLTEGEDYTVSYSASTRKNAGTYKIYVYGSGNYTSGKITKSYKITKASQSLKVTTSTKSVKYSSVKKKAQTVTAITKVSGAKGTVTYKKTSGSSKLTVSKTGKITVKKGTKKGTYKIKVKVSSASTTNYSSASKTVTITVKVK